MRIPLPLEMSGPNHREHSRPYTSSASYLAEFNANPRAWYSEHSISEPEGSGCSVLGDVGLTTLFVVMASAIQALACRSWSPIWSIATETLVQ